MSRAEKFIELNTKTYSNETRVTVGKISHWEKQPWLTPNEARRAVEIAREEIYEWLNEKLPTYIDYRCHGVGESVEEFVNDLRKAMKDE